MVEIKVHVDKCDGCATCVDICPVDVFEIIDGKSSPVRVDECLACGACETGCPNNAIEVFEQAPSQHTTLY